jgi:LacI family transcriptional regulator
MSTGRSQTIGVVLSDIENPFFAKATRGIDDIARAAGFDLILCNTDEDAEKERSAIDLLLRKRVAGIILAPATRDSGQELLRAQQQRPVVLFDRGVDLPAFDTVIADNRRGGYELTTLLIAAGHRRIAFVSTLDQSEYRRDLDVRSSSVGDRIAGFHDALDEAGIPDEDRLVLLNGRRDGIRQVIAQALDHGATAIVASDSLIAQHVMHVTRERGWTIPADVSLVSFDDADWTALSTPAITVMAQPIYEIGAEAARMLVRRLHERVDSPHVVIKAQRLVERESVAPPLSRSRADADRLRRRPSDA